MYFLFFQILLRHYFQLYVDNTCTAADPQRFEEARIELEGLFEIPELANVPFAILGNKIDSPNAVPEMELKSALNLLNYSDAYPPADNQRPVGVFMVSVVNKSGYADAFQWLSQFI